MASKTGKKKTTRKKKNTPQDNSIKNEVIAWIVLGFSIFLLISVFGYGGYIGNLIADLLNKMFGMGSYLFPFLLFLEVAFILSNKGNPNVYYKSAMGVTLFVAICMLFQLVFLKGGFFGALIIDLLIPAVGTFFTYIITILVVIISLVIMTGKSLIKPMNSRLQETTQIIAEKQKQHQTLRAEKKADQLRNKPTENKRSSKKVEGVSFSTTLSKKSPEIKEIKTEEPDFLIHRTEEIPKADSFIQNDDMGESPVKEEQDTLFVEKEKKPTKKLGTAAINKETDQVDQAILKAQQKETCHYKLPPLSLLKKGKKQGGDSNTYLKETALKLQQTLQNFGVNVTISNVSCGPSVTRYELQPEQGVKVSKIVGLADDIKLNLAAADIRIEAPIPGKAAVGIEVPNKENETVMLRDLIESSDFQNSASKISFAAGRDIAGKVVVTDIAKMPHLLVAGATGSGKSVCINTLIMSILYKASPDDVKFIMVDPKVVELSVYNGIPHLLIPVVTDPKKAAGALNWAVAEMTKRYKLFADYNVRDMKGFNEKIASLPDTENELKPDKMPQIIIIVDELADLMMVAPGEVEEAICRLAQLARAAGIHLVLATQRPSVNVITGLIKANMPSRIAFSVSSGVDSRTIIDMNGAEKLLGKGDMLFYPSGYQKPARVQGAFVSDKEVQDVVEYLKEHCNSGGYDSEIEGEINATEHSILDTSSSGQDRDAYFAEAGKLIIDKDKASIGMLQRMFKIGFNRAARIMDQLCEAGVVGGEEGTKPRKVLMSVEEFQEYLDKNI